jgi:kanamycin kinase
VFERAEGRPPVPAAVARIAGPREPVQVWHNVLGGLTYRLGDGPDPEFVKWCPHHPEFDVRQEAEKLRWAGRWIAVPPVLDANSDADGQWLHTVGLPGRTAVAPTFVARPELACAAIGRGLRLLHDRLPLTDCPFDWSVATRVELARFRGAGTEEARDALGDAPPIDRLVVCHGDMCAPNTLLDPDGAVTGYVDLGSLGVADRWADLAVASYSLTWNYAGDQQATFFAAYGVAPDPERIAYYRGLWDAT